MTTGALRTADGFNLLRSTDVRSMEWICGNKTEGREILGTVTFGTETLGTETLGSEMWGMDNFVMQSA